MRQFSRCTPFGLVGSESSRCLWPIRMKNCAADSAGMTSGVCQGETFPDLMSHLEVSHRKHNQTRPSCQTRVDLEFVKEPWHHTEGYCQKIQLNARVCVHGWLRNESGCMFVSLFNPFSARLSVSKQPLHRFLSSSLQMWCSQVWADRENKRQHCSRSESRLQPAALYVISTWAFCSNNKSWQIPALVPHIL